MHIVPVKYTLADKSGKCCDGSAGIKTSCCKTCHNCPNCYNLSFERIVDLLYSVEHRISDYFESYVFEKIWGFSKPTICKSDLRKLAIYRDILNRYRKSLIRNYNTCLCDSEIQTIIENVLGIVDINCIPSKERSDVISDKSGLEAWLLTSPGCLAFEDWESRMYETCPKLGIKVTNSAGLFKLVYEIAVDKIVDPYKLLYTLSVVSKAINEGCYDINIDVKRKDCKTTYELIIDKEQCQLDYNLLVESVKCNLEINPEVRKVLCGISFDTYVNLLNCNLSTTVISTILNCGIQVEYNAEKKCGQLVINKNVILLDEEFDVNILGPDVDLSLLETLTGSNCTTTIPIDLSDQGYS